ncbi:DUF2267 domain-containing protein [Couchioplanes azureus]|uniref:DUF2267 domain-containing protein n=1 Tax=Couchioplanes caeruleus TaxID=56438 RepID=UPI0019BBA18E|nr:DUF2267 domain-containing protein [Couchioplanes caeruleus]GGQ62786.1 hypothetical protein GCM10010166_35700 [Couchioplanes caeruleus subsp. azureus]
MHRDDLVSHVRARGRLHGRNEARRVIRTVLQACRQLVPDRTLQQVIVQLPAELAPPRVAPADDGAGRQHIAGDACRTLIRSVAQGLHIDEPNAAFLSRVVFEQLNSYCRGVTPASLAPWAPAEVRPLLSARPDDPARRYRLLLPTLGSAGAVLGRRPAAPAITPAPALPPRRPGRIRSTSDEKGLRSGPLQPGTQPLHLDGGRTLAPADDRDQLLVGRVPGGLPHDGPGDVALGGHEVEILQVAEQPDPPGTGAAEQL